MDSADGEYSSQKTTTSRGNTQKRGTRLEVYIYNAQVDVK